MDSPLTGQCLCGDIKFRLDGAVHRTAACHCKQCQRWAGHYWPSCSVSEDHLVLTQGSLSLTWYESSDKAERGFCIICGSSLFWRLLKNPEGWVAIALGALDTPTGLHEGEHIYTESAGDYYAVPQKTHEKSEE